MPELQIGSKKYDYSPGPSLLELLREMGVLLESPCGGKGVCGKCRIIVEGEAGPISEEEKSFLKDEELIRGVRLACLTYPEGDIKAFADKKSDESLSILTDGTMADFNFSPPVTWKKIELRRPAIKEGKSLLDCLEEALGDMDPDLTVLKRLPSCFGSTATAVYHGDTLIDLIPQDEEELYGLAIDIGTTTVVTTILSLKTGDVLGSTSSVNPQKDYGLDVISRIDHAQNEQKGLKQLKDAIVGSLNQMIDLLCRDLFIDRNKIYDMTIAANATMTTLLLGLDPSSLGKSPFSPVFRRGLTLKSFDMGIELAPGARAYTVPGVSAYIGSDIVAGIVATELNQPKGTRLFIDIGTNGEIVLSVDGVLSSCSCAAGPALEGMNISCGMRASEGAIESLVLSDPPQIKVIGNTAPKGLCGSAILEAMSELIERKKINKTGRLKEAPLTITPDICLTQKDIRQIQLARGAILSGFMALLEVKRLSMEDLDEVIVAGQFGKHLTRESLTGSGLIPKELKDKIAYCGNTSSTGAIMCLLSREAREKAEKASSQVDYVELSTLDDYDRLFTRCLKFEV